jgi:drug/metabolite transporter (DMT)-like permease
VAILGERLTLLVLVGMSLLVIGLIWLALPRQTEGKTTEHHG